MKPLVIDLFCGLGGFSEPFIEQGYRAVGFDIEVHDYGSGGYPGELILRDIRSINGSELVKEFGIPACIVASPPCQFFSYCAMPWSKAKKLMADVLASPERTAHATDLFNQCFRIQREVSTAAGHYVPLVVENVRGAQRWVGKARWNFGSFYLWGDVPALMPIPAKKILKYGMICAQELRAKNGNSRVALRDGVPSEGNKTAGMNWSDRDKKGQDFTRIAGQQAEGIKMRDEGYDYPERTFGWKAPPTSSKSNARRQASAEIAKIPPALASWIARVFKPK